VLIAADVVDNVDKNVVDAEEVVLDLAGSVLLISLTCLSQESSVFNT
jgi:hypothetical protein